MILRRIARHYQRIYRVLLQNLSNAPRESFGLIVDQQLAEVGLARVDTTPKFILHVIVEQRHEAADWFVV